VSIMDKIKALFKKSQGESESEKGYEKVAEPVSEGGSPDPVKKQASDAKSAPAEEPVPKEPASETPSKQEPVMEKEMADNETGKTPVKKSTKVKGGAKTKADKKSSKGYGDSPLGKALTFAEAQLKAKGDKLSNAELLMFQSKIAALSKSIGKDEDAAMVSVSQLIGGIIRA